MKYLTVRLIPKVKYNPDDYDEDGNNLVPCPICMNVHCPSKEDGKCPDEDMFVIEGEIRMAMIMAKSNPTAPKAEHYQEVLNLITTALTQAKEEGARERDEEWIEAMNSQRVGDLCSHYNRVQGKLEALTPPSV